MISVALLAIFHAFGLIIFILGVQCLLFFPLTAAYEIWKRRKLKSLTTFTGLVSVLVPAFNEERTIRATVESILCSAYNNIELIVINDGSTDGTERTIKDLIDSGRIVYISKPNGGKASALNRGIEAARGEVVLYTDADSIFQSDTIKNMVRWFSDPSIDAVCGNDSPLNPATPIQKFLVITTHIGTGFVRRALSLIRCLPIITGNLGAVRTELMRSMGGFCEIWGEDLELTFRLQKERKRIIFDPDPEVIAECPGSIPALWKQRVRWMRSYLKIALLHRDLFLTPRYWPFSLYFVLNFLNMAIVPLLQLSLLILIPWALASGHLIFRTTLDILTYSGIIVFLIVSVYSILLDRDVRDFVYLPYGLLILPFSYFYNIVTLFSWGKEIQGAVETWDKIERRPVMQDVPKPGNIWQLAFFVIAFIAVASVGTYIYLVRQHAMSGASQQIHKKTIDLALSTHFDAWKDWRDAISKVLDRPDIKKARVISVGAGRPDWVYFRWVGHNDAWADPQKRDRQDLLLVALNMLHKEGFKVAAIIDMYAPKYIRDHPEAAAVRFDGEASTNQVSLTELAEGAYGRLVLSMIDYVSTNYRIDIVNLTELSYYDYSYSKQDLESFHHLTGRKTWPRDRKGNIDKDEPSVWLWKSALMESFLAKVAAVVHSNRQQLYVDVPVNWSNFDRNGIDAGLDYRLVLNHADKIIVWNYFRLENLPPTVSEKLARHLVADLPLSSFYISIGLWGKKGRVDPVSLRNAVESTLKGGANQILITPNDLMTAKHWEGILPYLDSKAPQIRKP